MLTVEIYQTLPKVTSGNHSPPVVTKTHQWLPVFENMIKSGKFCPILQKCLPLVNLVKKEKKKEAKKKINKIPGLLV